MNENNFQGYADSCSALHGIGSHSCPNHTSLRGQYRNTRPTKPELRSSGRIAPRLQQPRIHRTSRRSLCRERPEHTNPSKRTRCISVRRSLLPSRPTLKTCPGQYAGFLPSLFAIYPSGYFDQFVRVSTNPSSNAFHFSATKECLSQECPLTLA